MASLSLYKIEQQNLNCCWDDQTRCYEYDLPYFVSEVAQDIFDTIKYLHENGVKVTVDSVVSYGNQRNKLIVRENIEAIRKQEYVPDQFNFYFKSLKKLYAQSKIQDILTSDLMKVVTSKNDLDVEKVRDISRFLDEQLELVDGSEQALQSISQIDVRYRGALVERKQGLFYSYGDMQLDRVLRAGAMPGQMTTIVGASGMGKSTLALNLFSKQISKYIPCMMVSLEMDEISTMDRLISIRKKIPTDWLYMRSDDNDNTMDSDRVLEMYDDEMKQLKRYENRFFMVDKGGLSTADIESLIQKAKQKIKTDYLICTIDLTTMLSDCGTDAGDIELCMNRLADIAKRQRVHIINVVQANRQTDNYTVKSIDDLDRLRPKSKNSIKNSQAIAERSRTVLTVFRKKVYAELLFPDSPQLEVMDDEFDVTVVKQSQGKVGAIVKYLYDGNMFRLDPFVDDMSKFNTKGASIDTDSDMNGGYGMDDSSDVSDSVTQAPAPAVADGSPLVASGEADLTSVSS